MMVDETKNKPACNGVADFVVREMLVPIVHVLCKCVISAEIKSRDETQSPRILYLALKAQQWSWSSWLQNLLVRDHKFSLGDAARRRIVRRLL